MKPTTRILNPFSGLRAFTFGSEETIVSMMHFPLKEQWVRIAGTFILHLYWRMSLFQSSSEEGILNTLFTSTLHKACLSTCSAMPLPNSYYFLAHCLTIQLNSCYLFLELVLCYGSRHCQASLSSLFTDITKHFLLHTCILFH